MKQNNNPVQSANSLQPFIYHQKINSIVLSVCTLSKSRNIHRGPLKKVPLLFL